MADSTNLNHDKRERLDGFWSSISNPPILYRFPLDADSLRDDRLGMNSHKYQPWITVAVFEDTKDGRILETFFRDRDIEARTYNDRLLQNFLFLCPPRVTYRVQVRRDHFDQTVRAMDENHPPILEKAIHCPECGSLRVNYPQMTRRFILPDGGASSRNHFSDC